PVNSGREQYTGGVWTNWNSNTADATFDYNGQGLKSYDKVNGGKYTELTYDDWQRLIQTDLPEVLDTGGSPITYDFTFAYDILSRPTSSGGSAHPGTTSSSYDVLGRLILSTDSLTFATRFYFDARG